MLGEEGFGLRSLSLRSSTPERYQKDKRFAGRPTLEKLFLQRNMSKQSRDQLIAKAVGDSGYSQMELASSLDLHYSTISRILAITTRTAKIKTPRLFVSACVSTQETRSKPRCHSIYGILYRYLSPGLLANADNPWAISSLLFSGTCPSGVS